MAGIGVEERGAPGLQRDRQLDREVAPVGAGGSPVHLDGQEPALDAESFERADVLWLRRELRQARLLEHVVEREDAPHEHFLGGVSADGGSARRRAHGRSCVRRSGSPSGPLIVATLSS